MTDGFDGLESELRALGGHLDVPETPEVTSVVRARLTTPSPHRRFGRRFGWRRWAERPGWVYAVVALLAVVLVLGATPPGRAVVENVLRFAGIEVHMGSGPSPSGPTALPGVHRVSLAEARRQVGFPIHVPAALGAPVSVTVADEGRVVTLVYARPAGEVRLDEFDGELHATSFEKYVKAEPDRFRRTTVAGRPALWISGEHVLVYVDRFGVERTSRTAGNVLVWQAGRVSLRLEGVADLEGARAVAGTVSAPS